MPKSKRPSRLTFPVVSVEVPWNVTLREARDLVAKGDAKFSVTEEPYKGGPTEDELRDAIQILDKGKPLTPQERFQITHLLGGVLLDKIMERRSAKRGPDNTSTNWLALLAIEILDRGVAGTMKAAVSAAMSCGLCPVTAEVHDRVSRRVRELRKHPQKQQRAEWGDGFIENLIRKNFPKKRK